LYPIESVTAESRASPGWFGFERLASQEDCYNMNQHPTRQIPDDELVEIADRPQLWISQNGYPKTLGAGWVRAAHITDRGRSPYPLENPSGVRVELAQMSRLWNCLGVIQEKRPA
jgi:hypothetical protein